MFLLFALRQFSCYFVRFRFCVRFAYSLFAFSVVFRTWNLFLHDVGVGGVCCCFLLCIKNSKFIAIMPNPTTRRQQRRRRRRQLLAQRRQDETMTENETKRKTSTRNKRKALPTKTTKLQFPITHTFTRRTHY